LIFIPTDLVVNLQLCAIAKCGICKWCIFGVQRAFVCCALWLQEETILISVFWFADWVETIHCDARSVYIHAEAKRRQCQWSG
jgi:hypothetical protein